jgi:citrate synthase
MLEEIGEEDRVDAFIDEQLAQKKKIMGIGHPRLQDARPTRAASAADGGEVERKLGDPKWIRMSERIAQLMKERKNLNAERRFLLGDRLLLARDSDRPVHSDFRGRALLGWCAHILEQLEDNRLFRPLSEYVGEPVGKTVVPVDER